jgi:hypothetical protein
MDRVPAVGGQPDVEAVSPQTQLGRVPHQAIVIDDEHARPSGDAPGRGLAFGGLASRGRGIDELAVE